MLCDYCDFSKTCALRTASLPVHYCEEYQVMSGKIRNVNSTPTINYVSTAIGLCASCDHSAECALIVPGSVIFNCEHYQ